MDDTYLPSIKKAHVVRPFLAMILSKVNIGADEIFISVGLLAVDETKLTEFISKMIKASPEGRKDEFKGKLWMNQRVR